MGGYDIREFIELTELRADDELFITKINHLARNKQETLRELRYYRDNGIRVKTLELL